MKKILLLIFLLLNSLCFASCETNDSSLNESSEVASEVFLSYGKCDNEEYLYPYASLTYNDENIPIYNCKINFSHTWNAEALQRMNSGVVILSLKGQATFKLKTTFKIKNKCNIRPLAKDVLFNIDEQNNIVEFEINESGQYTIELSNDRTIHLFVNEYGMYDTYKQMDNIMYFEEGIYNKDNCSYIKSDNLIHLNSNTIVFLDEGAIIEAGFLANNASNIKIIGNGIISGASFERSATTNSKLIPFEFNYCSDLEFRGITNLDPAGWCYNLYFCKDVIIDNVKVISSRSNGDGISIQSCENVTCSNSFARCWDDALVVKNYPNWQNKNIEGSTSNVHFYNCLIWSDLAQCMEIGYETVGEKMSDISFENITVLHAFHLSVISIHNANNANLNNVSFKNIIVEDASMGKGSGKNYLIELACEFSSTWSNGHKKTSLGQISNVEISNVNVLSASNPKISLRGSIDSREEYDNSIHYVKDVTIKDLYIEGKKIKEDYDNLELIYTENIQFI